MKHISLRKPSRISKMIQEHSERVSIFMDSLDSDINLIIEKLPSNLRLKFYSQVSSSYLSNLKSVEGVASEVVKETKG